MADTTEAQPYVDPRRLGEPPPMAQQIAALKQPSAVRPAPLPIANKPTSTAKPEVKKPQPSAPAAPAAPIPAPMAEAPLPSLDDVLKNPDIIKGMKPADLDRLKFKLSTQGANEETQAKIDQAKLTEKSEGLKTKVLEDYKTEESDRIEQHKRDIEEASPFAPTKESAKDVASLFALISVAAFGSGGKGKYAGMQTLASLTGAMKGYQEGRKDVYEKDIKAFEENLKVIKSHNDKINALYEDAMKLMATNKELGLQKIQEIIATDNTGIISRLARSGQYKAMGEAIGAVSATLTAAQDKVDKRNDEHSMLAQRFANEKELVGIREAAALERFKKEERLKQPEIFQAPDGTFHAWDGEKQQFVPVKGAVADMTKLGGTGGTKGSATQGQFENITSSDIGNAYFRINKFLETSKDGKIPTGSKYLRDKGTQSGIIDAYKNYLVNKTMPADLQKNDAALLGIAFDVVAARAFGRSSGVTDAKIAQVVKQLPVEGDTENTKREKMQILLNQLEEPNKLLPATKRKDALEYMKSPVGLGLYRSFAEKDESGTVPAPAEKTKYDAAKEARYQKWLKENPQ